MSRIEIRIHPNEKDALQRAADAAGMTLSGFVRYKLEAPLPDFRIAQQLGEIMSHNQESGLQEIALALEELRQQISQLFEHKENQSGSSQHPVA